MFKATEDKSRTSEYFSFAHLIKKIWVACLYLFVGVSLHAADYYPTPVDFGTVSYNISGGGFSWIVMMDTGFPTTGGSGNLSSRTGGGGGKYEVTNWESLEWRI